MKRFLLLVIVLLLIFFQGCIDEEPYSTSPATDIIKTNKVRKELGIREIKPEWEFYIHQFNTDKWKSGGYLCKEVVFDNELSDIIWEYDTYHTGVTSLDYEGSTIWEYVVIAYDYTANFFSINYNGADTTIMSLVESLEFAEYGYKAKSNEETLKIADELLAKLGLTRL